MAVVCVPMLQYCNVYHKRYQVSTHLENLKKLACKEYILNSGKIPTLPSDAEQKLDEMDKLAAVAVVARRYHFGHCLARSCLWIL